MPGSLSQKTELDSADEHDWKRGPTSKSSKCIWLALKKTTEADETPEGLDLLSAMTSGDFWDEKPHTMHFMTKTQVQCR